MLHRHSPTHTTRCSNLHVHVIRELRRVSLALAIQMQWQHCWRTFFGQWTTIASCLFGARSIHKRYNCCHLRKCTSLVAVHSHFCLHFFVLCFFAFNNIIEWLWKLTDFQVMGVCVCVRMCVKIDCRLEYVWHWHCAWRTLYSVQYNQNKSMLSGSEWKRWKQFH